jgi:hypothetical protein
MTVFEYGLSQNYGVLAEADIGKVSEKSLPYHAKHVMMLNDSVPTMLSAKILDCTEDILTYMRTHHPIGTVRSACNIVLGLRSFCLQYVMDGHSSLDNRYRELSSGLIHAPSLHQRELQFALKLIILAVRDNSYISGIAYCHNLLAKGKASSISPLRTLHIYRQIGYCLRPIQDMVSRGEITIKMINAVSSELETRELKKYKYRRPPDQRLNITEETLDILNVLDVNLDALFEDLEKFSMSMIVGVRNDLGPENVEDQLANIGAHFNINIEERVNTMIEHLGLIPSGPHNIIDLGDEPFMEWDPDEEDEDKW